MPTLIFTLEGSSDDLDRLRTRVDGAIHDAVDEATDDGDIEEDAVDISWSWD
jgi:hypothetical protein